MNGMLLLKQFWFNRKCNIFVQLRLNECNFSKCMPSSIHIRAKKISAISSFDEVTAVLFYMGNLLNKDIVTTVSGHDAICKTLDTVNTEHKLLTHFKATLRYLFCRIGWLK